MLRKLWQWLTPEPDWDVLIRQLDPGYTVGGSCGVADLYGEWWTLVIERYPEPPIYGYGPTKARALKDAIRTLKRQERFT